MVTKTLGPLHFEDLEPHRFEDLVRNLLYDFRDWEKIEPVGRAGADEGFDIRAWEKVKIASTIPTEEEEEAESEGPVEGNLWMIQCKREKTLGPKKVSEIVKTSISSKNPPHGYLLAAPVNFSKKSYDSFAFELRKKGVMEFFLWGKGNLEDMIIMPKNDHILFTFLGISLLTRRRSRVSEVRSIVGIKNKLQRVLGSGSWDIQYSQAPILIRDINDNTYPYKEKREASGKRGWIDVPTVNFHPLGLTILYREHYAFLDVEKKRFDFVPHVDLVRRQKEDDRFSGGRSGQKRKVEDFWEHFPRKNQVKFSTQIIIPFEQIFYVDDKGDSHYNCPHVYVDLENGDPLGWRYHYFTKDSSNMISGGDEIRLDKTFKKIKIFPDKFPNVKKGSLIKKEPMVIHHSVSDLFDIDGKLKLEIDNVIQVKNSEEDSNLGHVKVMHKYITTVKNYIRIGGLMRNSIQSQVGREVKDSERLVVYEVKHVYDWGYKFNT